MIELWQFNFSMYPEIVRWALDHKGLEYRTRVLLPGPHVLQLMPRFGQKTVPVLRDGARLLRQTGEMLDHLEAYAPSLLPTDAAQREAAWAWARRALEQWGPSVRLAGFHDLLPHAAYMARLWSQPFPPLARAAYVAGFPLLVRPVMRLDMGITDERAEAARAVTAAALDAVAEATRRQDYLVGGRFGLADLAVAAVLALTVLPEEYPLSLPQPHPRGVRRWLGRWRGHPGAAWVRRVYAVHRRRAAMPVAA
ncbi:glutathione S-transferase family protein [Sinimarinibacterium flocculans]|uniref:Glutathione S-transferase n=1 Tax=Sinimarinibacterium flocculans TaxID=985250 RepID=A0A318E393_9GAMM|nr:glutathione S-transferase N-terminal domain-containing protein [Sinimarinibacterium flocculans]PXV64570.1 glutathione S-transferase [Sinimarinibacterium flocculans]